LRVTAERAMNRRLEGSCSVPIAGFAVLDNGGLRMEGRVGRPDGKALLRAQGEVALASTEAERLDQASKLGLSLAEELIQQGAGAILAELAD